jgi:eukaryotic-like serine/threonine-protein kinase
MADTIVREQAELSDFWQTLGLEDQSVEVARTVSMRPTNKRLDSAPGRQVPHLPRLLRGGGSETMPELRIKGKLGEGGMGLVELAEQIPIGRDVAVKKVREDARSPHATLVLLREGWTTGLLEHPNIVPIYTLGRDEDGEPIIVMKKISGTSWLEIIDDPDKAPPAFEADDPVELHVEILTQICNAIQYAHSRGVLHRDLKPENVMLGEFGEVYVLDWGIAVAIDGTHDGRLAAAKDVSSPAGTPAYMAPEMVDGNGENLGVHTDVYLLGAMLYEALTGRPPHSGDTVYQIMYAAHVCEAPKFPDGVPSELAAICRRAMAREPGERFDSAEALREALAGFRKNRESSRLAQQGTERLAEVRELLADEADGQDIEDARLYKSFGECRFAFEQALEINPDNRDAVDGLQEALEAMAERELGRGAHKAASILIADLPRPDPDLRERLDALADQLAAREQAYEQLKHATDVEVGREGRMVFAIVMGVIWTILSLGATMLVESGRVTPTYPGLFIHIIAMTLMIAAILYIGRDRFFENEINRRIMLGVLVVFGCATVHRVYIWIAEMPLRQAAANEMLVYGVGAALIALGLDRRMYLASAPFLIGALVGVAWPASVFWVFTAANIVALALLAWAWAPNDRKREIKGRLSR